MRDATLEFFQRVRSASAELCRGLAIEDFGLQGVAEASPLKWHLAHTTWFFETFCLQPFAATYVPPQPRFAVLFNSYYNGIGAQYPRGRRHLLSRPTVAEVFEYRRVVDAAMLELLEQNDNPELLERTVLGLHHEQQHQELMLTDLKWNFSFNPLYPALREQPLSPQPEPAPLHFMTTTTTEGWIGHDGSGFAYDNEMPRHPVAVPGYQLAQRLITNVEYQAFIDDDGYDRPELWLADGWAWINQHNVRHPLHWVRQHNHWYEFTLHGLHSQDPHRPVTHVSFYEADAYARWADARLPTETEWELAAANYSVEGRFADSEELHPGAAIGNTGLQQLFGDCWEWTASPYVGYPGYRPAPGAIGEYNGKFMCNQMVLRGGSCATPPGHIRPSYRNFFYPHDRWQFTGIRLARDLDTHRLERKP